MVKKIIIHKSYHLALILFKKLLKLVKLDEMDNIFLDFEATTKGLFKKSYKFKIYYKFERKYFLYKRIIKYRYKQKKN